MGSAAKYHETATGPESEEKNCGGDHEQILDTLFANGPAGAADLKGITGLAVLIVGLTSAAEVLLGTLYDQRCTTASSL